MALLRQALAHRSWCAEVPGQPSNERLEFLGDAVLGWVVADLAYRQKETLDEGKLTDLRKAIVNADALAKVAEELGVGAALLLGKGESAAGGRQKRSILSDAFEAIIGAVYLDGGADAGYRFVEGLMGQRITATVSVLGGLDHKTALQELAVRLYDSPPVYRVRDEGPDHAKRFYAEAEVDGRIWGHGEGRSKKQAEQAAAREAFDHLVSTVEEVSVETDDERRMVRAASRRRRTRGQGRPAPRPVRPVAGRPAAMPELPEVEVVRRGLEDHVVGRRIVRVEVGRPRTVRRTSAEAVIAGLTGTTMTAAGRRGKYLVAPLDSGDAVMFHLRMSGQLRLAAGGAPRPPHTHVAMVLAGGDELWFVDPRTFGEVVVFDPSRAEVEVPELARLGPDPLLDELTAAMLRARLRDRARPIKGVLLDQQAVAGLGNIYTDEVLHAARVRFDRPAGALTSRQVGALHSAIGSVLAAAIAAGGSTLADAQYVGLSGQPGTYQEQHRVYGREGQACRRCRRSTVVRARYAGRSTFFCPRCQS